jgi:serine/threonine protein kinase
MGNSPGPNPASDTLQPGTVLFGEYEILGTIGTGGMGAIYQARHRSLGGLRAIKVIRSDAGLGKGAEEMFIREAKTLIDIHHDAIVHCHDLLRNEYGAFLIMELVEGPSLQRLLLRGPLPDDEWTVLKNRILEGLAVVHARGIIHRDISPGNIILPGSAPEKAKLIDFGVATPDEGKQSTGFSGNLGYASPEHFGLFGGRVDARSDLYSLGLVLAETTIGEALPMGQTFYEAKELRKVAPQLPDYVNPEIRKVLRALLEPNPAKRAESAQAVLEGRLPAVAAAAAAEKPKATLQPIREQAEADWWKPIVFTASAAGIGLGIGLTLWLWNYTDVLASAGGLVPPAVSAPVRAGNPTAPAPPPPQRQLPPAAPAAPSAPAGPARAGPAPASPSPGAPAAPASPAGTLSRNEVMAVAEEIASHSWICEDRNRYAPCIHNVKYASDWRPHELVRGEPYNWGGIDALPRFDARLANGEAAGSHSWDGVSSCTAGIDCSGFVTFCWGHRGGHAYGTATMDPIAAPLKVNPYTDLKPGDALNYPGKHIVLFAGYRPDGNPIIYEASGAAARVIRNEAMTWSKLSHYHPVRFRRLSDP